MIGAPWLQGSSHSCTFHHVELISESDIKTKKKWLHQQIEVASISCKARAWLKWVNPNLSTVRFHLHLHSWRASSKTICFDQLGYSVFPYFGRAYGYPSLTTACRGCLRRQMYLLGLYASQLSNDTPLGHLTGPNNLHQIGAAKIAAKSRREISIFSASASAFRPETPIAAALWVRSPHLALTGTQVPRVPRHIPCVGHKSLPERSRDFQLRGHSASPWVPQNGSLRSTCVKCLSQQHSGNRKPRYFPMNSHLGLFWISFKLNSGVLLPSYWIFLPRCPDQYSRSEDNALNLPSFMAPAPLSHGSIHEICSKFCQLKYTNHRPTHIVFTLFLGLQWNFAPFTAVHLVHFMIVYLWAHLARGWGCCWAMAVLFFTKCWKPLLTCSS